MIDVEGQTGMAGRDVPHEECLELVVGLTGAGGAPARGERWDPRLSAERQILRDRNRGVQIPSPRLRPLTPIWRLMMTQRTDALLQEAKEFQARRCDYLAIEYRKNGDLVSAENCEAKARELRA